MGFCSLHVHDQYSLLDSVARTEDLVKKAKDLNMSSLAITNHGNLFSHVKFYYLCKEHNIKPIIGVEAYVAPNHLIKEQRDATHLTLLAINNQGYRNLLKLVSIAQVHGFYYAPRIDWTLLEKYNEGLMCLSGCLLSELNQAILAKEDYKVKYWIERAKAIFKDRFYLEVTPVDYQGSYTCLPIVQSLSKKYKIPLVGTSDVHYVNPKDYILREAVWAIQDKRTLTDEKARRDTVKQYYLMGEEEIRNQFKLFKWKKSDIDEAIASTEEIASRCDVNIDRKDYVIAKYSDKDPYVTLQNLCINGFNSGKIPKGQETAYNERLNYELSVVKKMNLANYFLVVGDVLNFCRKENIAVGPGRGSAAGSLVCYILGITGVDPIKYNLLFERFLNPGRADSFPDIDTDIAHADRERVIEYLRSKYGSDHVCNIVTFGTMKAKAALKDAARVLNIGFDIINTVTGLIPNKIDGSPTDSLDQAIEEVKELREYSSNYPILFDLALKLEGTPRHVSIHASAFLVTPEPVDQISPLYRDPDEESLVCGIDMYDCEKLKILKFDFLGLKTLTVEQETLKLIKKRHNIDIDLNKLDFNDQRIWTMFCQAETVGTFQTETKAMQQLLKKIRPQNIQDLSVVNAMDRPGPLNKKMDDMYARRKRGEEVPEVLDESIKDILAPTYQTLVYQEQVMQIAEKFAGFSKSEADVLRKSMGKKKRELVLKMKDQFINGAIKLGRSREMAEKLFNIIEEFSEYAFNMSHSLAYSITSYHTAWLKFYYPHEFMCSILNVFKNNQEEIEKYIEECKRLNISVLAPDVNNSQVDFTLNEKNEIVFGFSAIRDVGTEAVKEIFSHRSFKSVEEFYAKVLSLNSKTMNALIRSGSFDSLYPYRESLLEYDEYFRANQKKRMKKANKTEYLFDMTQIFSQKTVESLYGKKNLPLHKQLEDEKAFLGYYSSGHPLDVVPENVKKSSNIILIKDLLEKAPSIQNYTVNIYGIIETVKRTVTKKDKKPMAFAKVSDKSGVVEIIVFPKLFANISEVVEEGKLVKIVGKISDDKIITDSITLLFDSGKALTNTS